MFKNFERFSLYVLKYQGWNSQNVSQIYYSKQGDSDQTASSEVVWSESVLFV